MAHDLPTHIAASVVALDLSHNTGLGGTLSDVAGPLPPALRVPPSNSSTPTRAPLPLSLVLPRTPLSAFTWLRELRLAGNALTAIPDLTACAHTLLRLDLSDNPGLGPDLRPSSAALAVAVGCDDDPAAAGGHGGGRAGDGSAGGRGRHWDLRTLERLRDVDLGRCALRALFWAAPGDSEDEGEGKGGGDGSGDSGSGGGPERERKEHDSTSAAPATAARKPPKSSASSARTSPRLWPKLLRLTLAGNPLASSLHSFSSFSSSSSSSADHSKDAFPPISSSSSSSSADEWTTWASTLTGFSATLTDLDLGGDGLSGTSTHPSAIDRLALAQRVCTKLPCLRRLDGAAYSVSMSAARSYGSNGGGGGMGMDAMAMGGEDQASCSCVEGNPCVVPYNCKDWGNRVAVARRYNAAKG